MKKKAFLYQKIISIFFILILMCSLPNLAHAENIKSDIQEKKISIDQLACMSGKECLDELKLHGLILPEVYDENPTLAAESIEVIINDIKNGVIQNEIVPYNYTELVKLALQVENVVNAYSSTYTLKDSTVIGSWKDSYSTYNCYGYAIDKTNYVNPGYYSNGNFNMNLSISSMADLVIQDLNSMGVRSF